MCFILALLLLWNILLASYVVAFVGWRSIGPGLPSNRQRELLVNVFYVRLFVPEKERFYTVHVAVDVDKKVTSPTKVKNKTKILSFCKN